MVEGCGIEQAPPAEGACWFVSIWALCLEWCWGGAGAVFARRCYGVVGVLLLLLLWGLSCGLMLLC